MVWAYFEKNEQFTSLVKTAYEKLQGFTNEEFKWDPIPHVTLAHAKQTLKPEGLITQEKLEDGSLESGFLRLYRSQPSSQGSKYSILAEFPFRRG